MRESEKKAYNVKNIGDKKKKKNAKIVNDIDRK